MGLGECRSLRTRHGDFEGHLEQPLTSCLRRLGRLLIIVVFAGKTPRCDSSKPLAGFRNLHQRHRANTERINFWIYDFYSRQRE